MPEFAFPLLIGACTLSLALAAGAVVWVVLFSPPAVIAARLAKVESNSHTATLAVEQIELRVTAWKTEIDSLMDQVDDALQRTDAKRKRAENSERRMSVQTGGEQDISTIPLEQLPPPVRLVEARRRAGVGS